MRPALLHRDWRGNENASEILNLTRPETIQEIHEAEQEHPRPTKPDVGLTPEDEAGLLSRWRESPTGAA